VLPEAKRDGKGRGKRLPQAQSGNTPARGGSWELTLPPNLCICISLIHISSVYHTFQPFISNTSISISRICILFFILFENFLNFFKKVLDKPFFKHFLFFTQCLHNFLTRLSIFTPTYTNIRVCYNGFINKARNVEILER
jgi:hypothetical protein